MTALRYVSIGLMAMMLLGCAAQQGQSVAERRSAVMTMQQEVLQQLYAEKPSVKSQIRDAVGYAVFDSANVNLILASFGGGYGVVKNNRSGAVTYMKMAEAGLGFGAGVKDFRLVMVFHEAAALSRFIEHGWAFGAQADAAAKAGDKGAAAGGEATVDNITVYQLTQSGIALQATIKGTKFWVDDELN
ncbi:hypothetical protein LJ739_15215 [Aestuariibacter halophilus]|uniref:Ysc84 actin-binding domain-containing protein n=1 Tax=Fluctibacter halophilus TaxID=226011 RepID=A0ABS8GAI0_9ALTE|nr:YSC84-related protein [Aestuariibacter halophilus]MCC2617602.1 hypothetical protein [Aestuariibacter halophilus]